MKTPPGVDPLRDALAALEPVAAREFHAYRVRHRCHRVLARRRSRLASPSRARRAGPSRWSLELLVASAIAIYLLTAVTEALHVLAGGDMF